MLWTQHIPSIGPRPARSSQTMASSSSRPSASRARPRNCVVVEMPPSMLARDDSDESSAGGGGATRRILDDALNEAERGLDAAVATGAADRRAQTAGASPPSFLRRDEARLIGMTVYSDPVRPTRGGRRRAPSGKGNDAFSAEELYNLALLRMEDGDSDAAASRFEASFRAASSHRDDGSASAQLEIMALSNAGYCRYLQENYSEASACFEGCVDLCRRNLDALRAASPLGGGDPARRLMIKMVESMTHLARSYDGTGRYREALVLVGEAVSLLDAVADTFDDVVRSSEELDVEEDLEDSLRYIDATVKLHRGEHDRAVRAYKKYLCLYTQRQKRWRRPRSPSPHPAPSSSSTGKRMPSDASISRAVRTAAAMHGVAHSLHAKSRRDESLRVALMAYTIRQRALSPSDPHHRDLADSAYLLGHLHRDAEEYVDALALYRRCVRVRCRTLGPDHRDTIKAMCYVAIVNRERNDLTEALYVTRAVLGRGEDAVPRRFRREMEALRDDLEREIEASSTGGRSENAGDRSSSTPKQGRVLYGWSGQGLHAASA